MFRSTETTPPSVFGNVSRDMGTAPRKRSAGADMASTRTAKALELAQSVLAHTENDENTIPPARTAGNRHLSLTPLKQLSSNSCSTIGRPECCLQGMEVTTQADGSDQQTRNSDDSFLISASPLKGPGVTSVYSMMSPRWFLGAAALVMLFSATFDTTATKFMNRSFLPPCSGCTPQYFEAPIFQTWTGYIGEFLLLPIYSVASRMARARGVPCVLDFPNSLDDVKKVKPSRWIWLLPLLLDFPSTMCLNYSTMLVRASTVQMLRSFNIILTFFLSAFLLKNRLYIHQLLGVILVLIGMTLVGLYEMIYPETETNYGNLQWLGVLMALTGTTLSSLQWVLEESIFRRYYCSPFEGVGWMGVYGIILGVGVLGLAHVTNLENTRRTLYQLTSNSHQARLLLLFALLYVISLSVNTASGITVTKLSSSLLRTIVNANRTVSIWVIEMVLGWETFDVLNFSGLVTLIMAMIVYNYNYFIHKTDHWCGDRALRTTAKCFPNKYEVTVTPTSPAPALLSSKHQLLNGQIPASTTTVPRRRTHAVLPLVRYKTNIPEEDGCVYTSATELEMGERNRKDDNRWTEIAAIELGH